MLVILGAWEALVSGPLDWRVAHEQICHVCIFLLQDGVISYGRSHGLGSKSIFRVPTSDFSSFVAMSCIVRSC